MVKEIKIRADYAGISDLANDFKRILTEIEALKVEYWLKEHSHTECFCNIIKVVVCNEKPPFNDNDFSDEAYCTAIDNFMLNNEAHIFYGWKGEDSDIRIIRSRFDEEDFDFTKACPKDFVYRYESIVAFNLTDETEYRSLIAQAVGCEIDDGKIKLLIKGTEIEVVANLDDFLKVFWCDFLDNKNEEV